MKTIITSLILLVNNFGYSQENLPDSVFVKIYSGVDYRSIKYGNGATHEVDSLCFIFKKEEAAYVAEKTFQTKKVFIYGEEDFIKRNINQDSTISIFSNDWVSKEKVMDLKSWVNLKKYESKILEKNLSLNDSQEFKIRDTLLVKKGINLEDFGVEEDEIITECLCENIRNKNNIDCSKIDFDNLFNSVLNENIGQISISSYQVNIVISFNLNGNKISLKQYYPGKMNTKWRIIYNDDYSKSLFVLNPRLNEIVSHFLPNNMRKRLRLHDFKDKSEWARRLE